MIVARIGNGKVRHVVDFRPDLDPCWRAVCGRARGGSGSLATQFTQGVDALPGCKACIRTLEDRLARLEGGSDGAA